MPGFSFARFSCVYASDLLKTLNSSAFIEGRDMFNNLFDFSKPKTLKESVGFYIFYAGVFGVITVLLNLMGVN